MSRFIKKLSLMALWLATVISMLLSLSSCAFLLPKVSEKLPDEEIIKVEKVTEISYDNVLYQELPQEKLAQFKDYLKELRYKKWINWRGLKLFYHDEERIHITYESFTVQLGEKTFAMRLRDSGEIKDSFTIDTLYPKDNLAKMFALFEY